MKIHTNTLFDYAEFDSNSGFVLYDLITGGLKKTWFKRPPVLCDHFCYFPRVVLENRFDCI